MKNVLKLMCVAAFLLASSTLSSQRNNAPMMGWSSWNANRININEALVKETADSLVSTGLKDLGYTWVNTDDGFFGGRDVQGNLLVNNKFPNGMKAVADYIHSKGLNAGIYSEAGKNTCAYYWDGDTSNGLNAGLYGHEEQDLRMFFQTWGFQFIKVDYCGAEKQSLNEKTTYTNVANIIRSIEAETGNPLMYNVCRWAFPGTWVTSIADSWRMSSDISDSFSSIRNIIEKNTYLSAYASGGHYNDMDMLQLGRGLNVEEEKTHFGMWCIMSSPLMIGCNMKNIRQSTLNILKNEEVIAVNQDALGLQAQIIARSGDAMVYAKPVEVANGKIRAVALFNAGNASKVIRVVFDDVQLFGLKVRNLWLRQDMGVFTDYYETSVPAHGTVMLRLEGDAATVKVRYQAEDAFLNMYNEISGGSAARPEKVSGATASGGYKVSSLGGNADNWLEFRNVYVPAAGEYALKVYYYSADNRDLFVKVNDTEYRMQSLNSGCGNVRAEASVNITLSAGDNVIRLYNSTAYAPDIDKIEISGQGLTPGVDNFDILPTDVPEALFETGTADHPIWYYISVKGSDAARNGMVFTILDNGQVGGRAKIEGRSSTPELDKQLWRFEQDCGSYTVINKAAGNKLSLGYDGSKSIRVILHSANPNTTWDLLPYNGRYQIKATANVASVGGDASKLYAHQADNYNSRNYVIMVEGSPWHQSDDSQFEFVRWSSLTGIENFASVDPVVEERYYNLQGMEVQKPGFNGVYFMKKIYASQREEVIKKMYIKK